MDAHEARSAQQWVIRIPYGTSEGTLHGILPYLSFGQEQVQLLRSCDCCGPNSALSFTNEHWHWWSHKCSPNGDPREGSMKSDPVTLTHPNTLLSCWKAQPDSASTLSGKLWHTLPRSISPHPLYIFLCPGLNHLFLDRIKVWGAASVVEQSSHTSSQHHSNAQEW